MNTFELYINKIFDAPLCIKQLMYLKLAKEMQANLCEDILLPNNNFSAYVPTLTFYGHNEITEKKCGLDNNIYNFLKYCEKGLNITEISMNSFLSLEETAKYFELCLENNFIEKPDNKELLAKAGYIAGKFRLGEYLEQIGKITTEQLDYAINKQKKNNSEKIAQILIESGFITEKDVKSLLILKEEAKKRFIPDYNSLPSIQTEFSSQNNKFISEIETLKEENLKLKRRMKQLLKFVKEKHEHNT